MNSPRAIARTLFREIKKTEKPEQFLGAFLALMKEKKKDYMLPSILYFFNALTVKDSDLHSLRLTFGNDPTKKTISSVQKYIDVSKDVPVTIKTDNQIIGGFIAEYKGTIYDGSVFGYIKKLKKKLLEV